MELSKGSALRLTVISVLSAMLCFVTVALLGFLFKSFWEYEANKERERLTLESLRKEIVSTEIELNSKKGDVAKLDEKWKEFINLTNEIDRVSINTQGVLNNFSKQSEKLQILNAKILDVENNLELTNAVLSSVQSEIVRVRSEVEEARRNKEKLVGVEGGLHIKRQELAGVESSLAGKKAELEKLILEISTTRTSIEVAQSNLVSAIEQSKGLEIQIKDRKGVVNSLEVEMEDLERKKKELDESVDDIEKTLKIQAPKEKILMDRLADLAGQYVAETNRLDALKKRTKEEIREMRANNEVESKEIKKTAEEKHKRANEVLVEAEKKAVDILLEAKNRAAEVERVAKEDKKASEAAIKEKLDAEAAALVAKQEKIAIQKAKAIAEEEKSLCEKKNSELLEIKLQREEEIRELEQKLVLLKKQAGDAKVDLNKINEEVRAMREIAERLTLEISLKQVQLKRFSESKSLSSEQSE
jgi:hypothetical protein